MRELSLKNYIIIRIRYISIPMQKTREFCQSLARSVSYSIDLQLATRRTELLLCDAPHSIFKKPREYPYRFVYNIPERISTLSCSCGAPCEQQTEVMSDAKKRGCTEERERERIGTADALTQVRCGCNSFPS